VNESLLAGYETPQRPGAAATGIGRCPASKRDGCPYMGIDERMIGKSEIPLVFSSRAVQDIIDKRLK